MTDKPEAPADPRPNDEPYYIDNECHECGGELVYYHEHYDLDGEPWYDEFVCPSCEGGLYMDWPEETWDGLMERVEDAKKNDDFISLEEMREEFGLEKEE